MAKNARLRWLASGRDLSVSGRTETQRERETQERATLFFFQPFLCPFLQREALFSSWCSFPLLKDVILKPLLSASRSQLSRPFCFSYRLAKGGLHDMEGRKKADRHKRANKPEGGKNIHKIKKDKYYFSQPTHSLWSLCVLCTYTCIQIHCRM